MVFIAQLLVFREQALRQQLLDLETEREASLQLRLTQEQVTQSTAPSPLSESNVFLYDHSAMLIV